MHRIILLGILGSFLAFSQFSLAQTEEQDLDVIEAEIKKSEVKAKPIQEDGAAAPQQKVETLADLSKLQPFSEVSILQKRFMPKTGRFQFFGGLGLVVNDPWNSVYGANLRAAYGFTEAFSLEVTSNFLSGTASTASQDLLAQHNVNAKTFGSVRGFTGGQILWTPVYGKMSLLNQRIIPFDMYFGLGMGNTSLDGSTVTSASTTSLSTGQIFALSKSMAFRWDLTWNIYSLPTGSVNNLLLMMGASWYIPEVSYR